MSNLIIKQAEATIREALTEGAAQLALLAKHPSQNPWIKQLKEAVIALDTLMTAQGEIIDALEYISVGGIDKHVAEVALSKWGEEPIDEKP